MMWEKYVGEYIEFVNKNFDISNNIFIVIKRKKSINQLNVLLDSYENIYLLENVYSDIMTINNLVFKADKIILHGLFNTKVNLMLFFNRNLLKKSNWMIWGGDLYYYKYRDKDIKSNLKEFIRKSIIKNLSEITAVIKGDYEVAKKVYKSKARYNYACYKLPVDFKTLDKTKKDYIRNDKTINIQIGNSADPTNEHIEILNKLSRYKNENIRIICPLSYGSKEYGDSVIKYGKEVFGEKFVPIIQYLNPNEYSEVLLSVDIAIFNHKRQQGLGNIIALLYLGKKVYIRGDITPWKYFEDLEVKMFETDKIDKENFEIFKSFDSLEANSNINIVKKEFSEENYINMWSNILKIKY